MNNSENLNEESQISETSHSKKAFHIDPQEIANTGKNFIHNQPGTLSRELGNVKKMFDRDRGDTRDK